jgi:hypothetical protein
VETSEFEKIVDELRFQWRMMWRERVDDKIRAEGIAIRDYPMLFVERGLVIVATRDYESLDFSEILQQRMPAEVSNRVFPLNPSVGGWRKFVRDFISKEKRFTKRGRAIPQEVKPRKRQQLKKGGRGWIHSTQRV